MQNQVQQHQNQQQPSAASNSCATCSSCGGGAQNGAQNVNGEQQIKIKIAQEIAADLESHLEVVRQENSTQTEVVGKSEAACQTEGVSIGMMNVTRY